MDSDVIYDIIIRVPVSEVVFCVVRFGGWKSELVQNGFFHF